MRRASPLAALLLLAAAGAQAQDLNLSGGGPVEITARDAIEWRQVEQVVVARGAARAVRDGVTVTADRLVARYRPRAGEAGGAQAAASPAASPLAAGGAGGASQIWRLEAEGNVRIATATDTATADRAVYDMDQSVLVLTGRNLTLTTPQDRVTARDSLEYWSARRMAVARGDAVVQTPGRRMTADTLVAYFLEQAPPPAAGAAGRGAARPASAPGQPDTGRLDRVDAFGNVTIRTELETVRGDRGAYDARSRIARLGGDVRITRGPNQLNGDQAEVNMATGVARLLPGTAGRVQGLVVPEGAGPAPAAANPGRP